MGKILCFGEFLLRFSPAAEGSWLQSQSMPVYMGGAELNVASALAKWNMPVSYCSALPDNYMSADIIRAIQERGIMTDTFLLTGQRIGGYYLAQGTDLKNSSVIYDRDYSSFGELKTGMFNWDHILRDISWLHFSAISPALNESVSAVCLEMLQAASRRNITISVDLNYRPKLWKQRNPHEVMSKLLPYCDVVMGNIWSMHDLLAIPLDHAIIEKKDKSSYLQHAHQSALKMLQRFARVKSVACTFRFENEERGVLYYGSLYSDHHFVDSSDFTGSDIIDKVGTGDCFMAGLIYGFLQKMPAVEIVQFASAAAFGKFFEKGDSTHQDLNSIRARISAYE